MEAPYQERYKVLDLKDKTDKIELEKINRTGLLSSFRFLIYLRVEVFRAVETYLSFGDIVGVFVVVRIYSEVKLKFLTLPSCTR